MKARGKAPRGAALASAADGVVGGAFGLARRRGVSGQRHDPELVDRDSSGAAVRLRATTNSMPSARRRVLSCRRPPGEADLAGRDDDVLPFGGRAEIAPGLPPHIVAVRQLELQIVAAAGAANAEANFEIGRQVERDRAPHEGVARHAAEIVAHLDRAADGRAGSGRRCPSPSPARRLPSPSDR